MTDLPRNETLDALRARKSVRVFTAEPVTQAEYAALIEAAMQAPTAGAQQLYTILHITDAARRARLAELCDHQPFIAQAPLVLIFLADCRKWYEAYRAAGCAPRAPGAGDLLLAWTDACIAAQNVVVAAQSLGLGSCYIGDVLENAADVRALLRLPAYCVPAAMLVLGRPAAPQLARRKPVRFDARDIVRENVYGELEGAQFCAAIAQREMREIRAARMPAAAASAAQVSAAGPEVAVSAAQVSAAGPEAAASAAQAAASGAQAPRESLQAFCARKYNSAFAREMTRSAEEYLRDFLPQKNASAPEAEAAQAPAAGCPAVRQNSNNSEREENT